MVKKKEETVETEEAKSTKKKKEKVESEVKEEESKKEDKKEEKKEESKEDKKSKLAKLLEKAKKLEGKVEEIKDIDLKKKVKPEEEHDKKDTLVPMEDYLKSSIHLGTRVITPDMRKYVYRRRADGLAVFNTALLDDKMRESITYLSKFEPKDIILICKREAGWKAVNKFAELTGVRVFTKKYPAGILTNTNLDNFTEAELVFICDPWLDKNALMDANRVSVPVLSICDTNNLSNGVTHVLPGNNKSAKSLGMILYLLAKFYIENKKIKIDGEVKIQDFIDDWDNLQPPK